MTDDEHINIQFSMYCHGFSDYTLNKYTAIEMAKDILKMCGDNDCDIRIMGNIPLQQNENQRNRIT